MSQAALPNSGALDRCRRSSCVSRQSLHAYPPGAIAPRALPMSAHGPQPLGCPRCHKPVDVKSRHVSVAGSTVRVYCSDACLQGISVLATSLEIARPAPRRWRRWWFAAGVALSGTTMILYAVDRDTEVEADQLTAAIAPV